MTIVTLGIDLGKTLCSIAGMDGDGAVVLRRRVRRSTLVSLADKLAPCTVAMEACCGAHHVGRLFAARGHDVRLMSPEYVRPYVKAQKNDDRDAEAIAEAATRPTMRFVELKSQDQLDLQTLHRARSRVVGVRQTLLNQLRAILLERGITFPQGRRVLEREVDALIGRLPIRISSNVLKNPPIEENSSSASRRISAERAFRYIRRTVRPAAGRFPRSHEGFACEEPFLAAGATGKLTTARARLRLAPADVRPPAAVPGTRRTQSRCSR